MANLGIGPYNKKFMKELIQVWGIPENKIIEQRKMSGFTADSILISTNISRNEKIVTLMHYYRPETLQYIRNKILNKIEALNIDTSKFSKKIFISRADAPFRRITNEDEMFELFKKQGYKRYYLSDKSLTEIEQIALFHNATHIAGASGSNMTNILFAQRGTNVLEFIQIWADRTFYPISMLLGLNYHCLCDLTDDDLKLGKATSDGRIFPIQKIEDFLSKHYEF